MVNGHPLYTVKVRAMAQGRKTKNKATRMDFMVKRAGNVSDYDLVLYMLKPL
jgi:hypothetical protein